MEIYTIRQIIETVEGHKLKNVKANLYGAYKSKNTVRRIARKLSKQIAKREKLIFLEGYPPGDEKKPFTKDDCAVLYKGDDINWWTRHFIEIISMKIN